MARAKYTEEISEDLMADSGNIMWSFIQGEQLEYPINLNFVEVMSNQYDLEAVIVEGANDGKGTKPIDVANPSAIEDTLDIRIPLNRGVWNETTADYVANDYALHEGKYYILNGSSTVGVSPDLDTSWEAFTPNRIYVQFKTPLSSDYSVQPTVGAPVFGFFELRVTEPTGPLLTRTWKPVRGLVEFVFSPTRMVI